MTKSGNAANTASAVRQLMLPVAQQCGVSVWDVEYVKEGGEHILRVTIDSPQGIDSDTCYRFTELANPVLDSADPIEESYMFEVSSPGLGRRLRLPEHFAASIGVDVTVRLIRPADGKREYRGKLDGYDSEAVKLNTSDGGLSFAPRDIAYVKYNDDEDLF